MKRVLVILLAIVISLPAEATAQLVLPAGATGQTVHVRIVDSISAEPVTGLDDGDVTSAHYTRAGELREPITLEELTDPDDAHDPGGFIEVANGLYRLDLPDDALEPGADVVTIDLVMDDPTHTARPLDIALRNDGTIAVRALARSLGYDRVVEVGDGLEHETIADGLAAASAGELVYVHPGIYDDANLAADGKPIYLARGAQIHITSGSSNAFANNIANLVVLGHGEILQEAETTRLASTNANNARFRIEASRIESDLPAFSFSGTNVQFKLAADVFAADHVMFMGEGGLAELEIDNYAGTDGVCQLDHATAVCIVRGGTYNVTSSAFAALCTGGTLMWDANRLRATSGSSTLVSTFSGLRFVGLGGALERPSTGKVFSGNGEILLTDAVAYDPTDSDATNIVRTPTQAIYAKLPVADFLLGTSDGEGRIAADSFDGDTAFPLAQADSGDGEVLRVGQLAEVPTVQEAVQEGMDNQGYTEVRAERLDNLDAPISEIHSSLPTMLVSTTIESTPTAQTVLQLAAGPPDDNALSGALIVVTSSSDATQKAVGLVRSYDGGTRTVTLVADPGIFAMDEDDHVDVIASGVALPLLLQ